MSRLAARFEEDVLLTWEQTPPEVRAAIVEAAGGLPEGHSIWRCPRRSKGGRFKPDRVVIEYWWQDETGELLAAYWLE